MTAGLVVGWTDELEQAQELAQTQENNFLVLTFMLVSRCWLCLQAMRQQHVHVGFSLLAGLMSLE